MLAGLRKRVDREQMLCLAATPAKSLAGMSAMTAKAPAADMAARARVCIIANAGKKQRVSPSVQFSSAWVC